MPLKHRLMQARLEREGLRRLAGAVQRDDAYWGGRRRGCNRRFDLAGMLLASAAAHTPPMPYPLVRLAEAHW